VVFVHPTASPDPAAHALGLPDSLIDFVADTTRASGTIPFLATRFGIVDEMGVIPGQARRGTAADTFRRLYWDTALSWRDPVLDMLRSVVGIDHVLYGSDFPYLRRDLAITGRRQLALTAALSGVERAKVFGATAASLLPRFASREVNR
jgi:aminocarboxymuconate-semialdehyde decarboxylase